MLTIDRFERQAESARLFYKADNEWVTWVNWDNQREFKKHVGLAYKLYTAVASNRLKFTLLGGTEIRKNRELISAFGITAATGVQDGITGLHAATAAMDRFKQVKQPDPDAPNADLSYARVEGGSILSEKEWSPVMNDALIMGSATAKQYLALGLTPLEQKDWNSMNAAKVNKVKVAASQYKGGEQIVKNAWKNFFNANPKMFFMSGHVPRVFTRELLGLIAFGYTAEISYHQVGFRASKVHNEPNFNTYIGALRDVHFEANTLRSRKTITAKISKFLFGATDQLESVADPLGPHRALKDDPLAAYRTLA